MALSRTLYPAALRCLSNPANDPFNPLRYIASDVLTAIAFGTSDNTRGLDSVLVHSQMGREVHAFYGYRRPLLSVLGLDSDCTPIPNPKGIYIIEYLFVVLSPSVSLTFCVFKITSLLPIDAPSSLRNTSFLEDSLGSWACDKHLMVSPRRITIVFISSDITTFLVQAAGGSVSISSDTLNLAKIGSNIFLAGLVMQLASFLTFTCIFGVFMHRVHMREPEVWAMHSGKKWHQDWRALAGAMTFSFVGILIRSGYRVAELSQGYVGHLATTESYFYGLDTLPLFIAIAIYVFFWPGRIIGDGTPPTTIHAKEESSINSDPPVQSKET
ncbi:RTA1-domain-containing protein [Mycena polygramma]|nr:RTA1-domain-containing protein [Mycena polygramma]